MCVSKQPCDHPPDDFVDEETAIEYFTPELHARWTARCVATQKFHAWFAAQAMRRSCRLLRFPFSRYL